VVVRCLGLDIARGGIGGDFDRVARWIPRLVDELTPVVCLGGY
jgi:hypothetical protein